MRSQLFVCNAMGMGDLLGITHTRETGPADVRAIGKEINQVLCFGQFVEV